MSTVPEAAIEAGIDAYDEVITDGSQRSTDGIAAAIKAAVAHMAAQPAESVQTARGTQGHPDGADRPAAATLDPRAVATDRIVEAAAIASFIEGGVGEDETDWADEHPGARKSYRDNARAIVEAVTPLIEAEVRRQIAATLTHAAAGRRHYIAGSPEARHRQLLDLECTTIESAAEVVMGGLRPLFTWLPSWLWTAEMDAELRSRDIGEGFDRPDRTEGAAMSEPRYRVGRKVGRTVYQDGHLIGLMDTPELAALVVTALNARETT